MMRSRRLTLTVTAVSLVFLTACCYLSESPGSCTRGRERTYSELKNEINGTKLSDEQLNQIMAECPRPNGVFEAAATSERTKERVRGYYFLDHFFRVAGFRPIPATSYPGGREGDEPIPVSLGPIHILGGIKDGVRQAYSVSMNPPEQFTLELRPLRPGRFRIGVTSVTFGRSAEAEGEINLTKGAIGLAPHCENGILKTFAKLPDGKMIPNLEISVDPATGDIVAKSVKREELSFRFKRIGD